MFSRAVFGLLLIATVFGGTAPPTAGDVKLGEKRRTLWQKSFKVESIDDGKERGRYELRADLIEATNTIEIYERKSMPYLGAPAQSIATVMLTNASPPTPKKGSVETRLGGKVCMKGSVSFSGKTFDCECTGFLEKRTQAAIDPPKVFTKKDQPVPEGVLLVPSSLPFLGPRLISKEGELANVVFVEFPDDLGAPELINFKDKYRLVREAANDQGEYELKVFSPNSRKSRCNVRFNKLNQFVSMEIADTFKFVEITDKK